MGPQSHPTLVWDYKCYATHVHKQLSGKDFQMLQAV